MNITGTFDVYYENKAFIADLMKRFTVIEGGSNPKFYHKKGKDQQIECHVCQEDIGISTSLAIKAIQSPMRKTNSISGGTAVLLCVHCILRGKVTVLS